MMPIRLLTQLNSWFSHIPYSPIALLGRFAIAATFWKSGQTKIDGLAIDFISGEWTLGWPTIKPLAIILFKEEYQLPWLDPEWAAIFAAVAEHLFPLLLLLGLASRLSAFSLLIMTIVIQLWVYPHAYPLHGVWATVLLLLMQRGAGIISVDHWLARRLPPAR